MDALIGLNWTVVARPVGSAQIRFRLRTLPPGKQQISISTGHTSPDALTLEEQRKLIARWAEAKGVRIVAPTAALSFERELERFLSLKYEGLAESTVSEAKRLLEQFGAILGGVAVGEPTIPVTEITKKLCEDKKDEMRAGRSSKYWKNFITAAKKFVRWQVTEGHIPSDPLVNFKNPSRKTFGRRTAIWTQERYGETMAELAALDREILPVIRWTGMDSADFFQLAKSHIIEVMDAEGRKFWKLYKLRSKAKSEEETIDQPLSPKIEAIILARWHAQPDPEGKLWPMPQYKDSDSFADAVLRRVKAAQSRAGQVPTMDIKSLRHTFATYHARRYLEGRGGPPMEELRRWMGHAKDSRVLEKLYVHAKASGRFMD